MSITPATLHTLLSSRTPQPLPHDNRLLAAVLVPMLWESDDPSIILTRRTDDLKHHRGQISFPGGQREEDDRDFLDTALREADEEIGLPRDHVTVLGQLDDYHTRTTIFHMTPFVGEIRRPEGDWVPDISEVAEIIEVPLSHLMNPDTHTGYVHTFKDGHTATTAGFHWGDDVIWGATAEILKGLVEMLGADYSA